MQNMQSTYAPHKSLPILTFWIFLIIANTAVIDINSGDFH